MYIYLQFFGETVYQCNLLKKYVPINSTEEVVINLSIIKNVCNCYQYHIVQLFLYKNILV